MTIAERMKTMLVDNGLFDSDAVKVMEQAKESEVLSCMNGRWDEDITGYQSSLLSVVWISVKSIALSHIDETCPGAWYRSMFVLEKMI